MFHSSNRSYITILASNQLYMKISRYHSTLTFIVLLTILSCQKEKNWRAEIHGINIDSTSVTVKANFSLSRNNNYVDAGICWSESTTPTVLDKIKEQQVLHSEEATFYLDGLNYGTSYHVRSFIKTNNSEIIYSEAIGFDTDEAPKAPCTTESGKMNYNGADFLMGNVYENTNDHYKLSTSSGFGDLDFTFFNKPSKNNLYTTVSSSTDLDNNKVLVTGVLGLGWLTCFHGSGNNQPVYVEVTESGTVIVKLCEFKMYPTGSCSEIVTLTGEIQK